MGGISSSSQPTQQKRRDDNRFEPFISSICDESSKDGIDRNKFITSFPPEVRDFAGQLVAHITSRNDLPGRAACHQAFQRIISLSTSSAQVTFYLSLCKSQDGALAKEDCLNLFRAAYYFHCQTSFVKYEAPPPAGEGELANLVSSVMLQGEANRCIEWMNQNCPEIFGGLHSWLIRLITASLPKGVTTHSESFPPSSILSGALWWLLSASLPSEFSEAPRSSAPSTEVSQPSSFPWTVLYRSDKDGLSTNRLQHHAFAYRGPSVFLVLCSDGYSYALAVDAEWREGVTPWGGQNSFLVQLSPVYKILEEGDKMVLLNEKSRNIPKGLFIGRDRSKYSIKITEGLQSAEHDGKMTDVLDIEVWGCGGSSAKAKQLEQKNREKRDIEKNAKVKLPCEWDENPDRLLLEWGGVRPSYGDQFKAEFGPDARS